MSSNHNMVSLRCSWPLRSCPRSSLVFFPLASQVQKPRCKQYGYKEGILRLKRGCSHKKAFQFSMHVFLSKTPVTLPPTRRSGAFTEGDHYNIDVGPPGGEHHKLHEASCTYGHHVRTHPDMVRIVHAQVGAQQCVFPYPDSSGARTCPIERASGLRITNTRRPPIPNVWDASLSSGKQLHLFVGSRQDIIDCAFKRHNRGS